MECEIFMKFSRKWKFQVAAINRILSNPAYPANPAKRFD